MKKINYHIRILCIINKKDLLRPSAHLHIVILCLTCNVLCLINGNDIQSYIQTNKNILFDRSPNAGLDLYGKQTGFPVHRGSL